MGLDLSDSDTDFSLGGYARGRAYYQAGRSWTLGVEVRGSFGLEALNIDTDYVQVGVTLGYGHYTAVTRA